MNEPTCAHGKPIKAKCEDCEAIYDQAARRAKLRRQGVLQPFAERSDETEGRKLYRARADKQVTMDNAATRPVRLVSDSESP